MKTIIQIQSVSFTNGDKLQIDDYVDIQSFEEEILERLSQKTIEYYAIDTLDLNTEEYHIENACDSDLVWQLRDNGYNFPKEVDLDDAIDICEKEGYEVIERGLVGNSLDIVDSQRLDEITQAFLAASWLERESIYKNIMRQK